MSSLARWCFRHRFAGHRDQDDVRVTDVASVPPERRHLVPSRCPETPQSAADAPAAECRDLHGGSFVFAPRWCTERGSRTIEDRTPWPARASTASELRPRMNFAVQSKRKPKRRSLAQRAGRAHFAAHQFRQPFADGQT